VGRGQKKPRDHCGDGGELLSSADLGAKGSIYVRDTGSQGVAAGVGSDVGKKKRAERGRPFPGCSQKGFLQGGKNGPNGNVKIGKKLVIS